MISRCGVLAELTHSWLVWGSPIPGEQRVPCGRLPLASMTSEVVENEFEFYSKAEKYWKDVPATVDGMLGGYGHISSIDINSSRKFLQRFLRVGGTVCHPHKTPPFSQCGAGLFPLNCSMGSSVWLSRFSSVGFTPHGGCCRMAPTGQGQPVLWTAGLASAGSPSGCCCPSSRQWTWWM